MVSCRNQLVSNVAIERDSSNKTHHDYARDLIRVGVGSGPAVLKVAVALGGTFAWNTDRRATVGDTPCELVDGTGLVATGKTELVALAVDENVCESQRSVHALV